MRALSASKLLNAWERGSRQPPVERALLLLGAACPEQTPEELAQLSIGRRDSLLLDLRERTFGSQFVSRLVCQKCGEQLELAFKVSDIEVAAETNDPETLTLNGDGYDVMFRLPNSEDVRAATVASGDREQLLLQRCLLRVSKDGVEQSTAELPAALVEMVVDRMARADPQSVPLSLVCAACSHKWFMGFDIVSYFWSELNAWTSRMLREVHVLASTYGWRENDILAMNPWRRQSYLEMIGK